MGRTSALWRAFGALTGSAKRSTTGLARFTNSQEQKSEVEHQGAWAFAKKAVKAVGDQITEKTPEKHCPVTAQRTVPTVSIGSNAPIVLILPIVTFVNVCHLKSGQSRQHPVNDTISVETVEASALGAPSAR